MKRRNHQGRDQQLPITAAMSPRRGSLVAIDLAALGVAVLCALLAWTSRGNLNVDGVSYLDLAAHLARGGWSDFVQGYWSPAYPALLAPLVGPTGVDGSGAVALAHLLNFWISLWLIGLVWLAARRRGDAPLAAMGFTAMLVCSARTLRLDAVTPDLLLLVMVTGMGLELLRADGWRGTRVGLWAAGAYLAKTSTWPWLVVVAVMGLAMVWRQPLRRREWGRAVAAAALPVLCWVALLAAESGWSTFADSGRYGKCWYLHNCDGRSPDTHLGEHVAYQRWSLDSLPPLRVAVFEPAGWTYTPWSDPSAWQRGIVTQRIDRIQPVEVASYLLRQAAVMFRYWLPLLIILVLLPARLTSRELPPPRSGWRIEHFLVVAGVLGVCQFLAVHAEPRLIAPFVLLASLGFLHRVGRGTATRWRAPAAWTGLLVALGIGVEHLGDQARVTRAAQRRVATLEETFPAHLAPHRIAIAGKAFGMVPDLYLARGIATAQVMGVDGRQVRGLPSAAQQQLAARMRQGGATAAWLWTSDSGYSVVLLPGSGGQQ